MKIEGPSGYKNISSIKKRKDASGSSDFISLLSTDDSISNAQEALPPQDVNPVSSLDTLLSLQEMPDEEVKMRRAVLQGKAVLDDLEQLRHALLHGSVSQDMLGRLSQYVKQQKPLIEDPRLSSALDDIELRVAVELAKLERNF